MHVVFLLTFLGAFAKLRKAHARLSVRPPPIRNTLSSLWTDFNEIRCLRIFLENLSRKFKFKLKPDEGNGYMCAFKIISRWIILRMRNVPHESCRVNQNAYFTFSNPPPPRKSCSLRDDVENMVRAGQATNIRRMRCAGRITKATNTCPESVMRAAFPPQWWRRERYVTRMLLCTYVACLVTTK